jgi:FkbM family methyltransferase
VSEALVNLRARRFSPASIVDVGVAEGTPELYEAFPEAYLYLLEAAEEYRPHLMQIVQHRKGEFHTVAVGSHDGTATFRVSSDPRKSTLRETAPRKGIVTTEREVKITRLDSLNLSHLPTPILLKIDVEGAEIEVLRGAQSFLAHVEVVLVETSLWTCPKNEAPAEDAATLHPLSPCERSVGPSSPSPSTLSLLLSLLESHGFTLYDIVGAADARRGGPLAHADLLFVKHLP